MQQLDAAPDDTTPAVVVRLDGEWDIARRGELRARMNDALDQVGSNGHVIVDLTDTAFLDSITLSVLLSAQRHLRRGGGHVTTVCKDGSFVLRTLRTAGLDGALRIEVR